MCGQRSKRVRDIDQCLVRVRKRVKEKRLREMPVRPKRAWAERWISLSKTLKDVPHCGMVCL